MGQVLVHHAIAAGSLLLGAAPALLLRLRGPELNREAGRNEGWAHLLAVIGCIAFAVLGLSLQDWH